MTLTVHEFTSPALFNLRGYCQDDREVSVTPFLGTPVGLQSQPAKTVRVSSAGSKGMGMMTSKTKVSYPAPLREVKGIHGLSYSCTHWR